MSMIIRDPVVDALAAEVMQKLGAKTKAEAIRLALENELKRGGNPVPVRELIEAYQREVAAIGLSDPSYNHKAHMDEGWEM